MWQNLQKIYIHGKSSRVLIFARFDVRGKIHAIKKYQNYE